MLNNFFSVLNIAPEEQKELEQIFNAVVKRELKNLIHTLNKNRYVEKEVFSFLFDFYKIDINKIETDEKEREKAECEKLLCFETITINIKLRGLLFNEYLVNHTISKERN